MPITYDIYTDYLYQKGKAEGQAEEKARAEETLAEERARAEQAFAEKARAEDALKAQLEAQRRQSVVKMLRRGALTDEEIADFANASVGYVRHIKAELAGQ